MNEMDKIIKNLRSYSADIEISLKKLSYEIDRLRDELGIG